MILAALALAGLAIGSVPRHDLAFWFVLAVAVSLVILTGLARLLLAGLARFRPELGLPLRLALANLRASGGGAAAVIVALGAGLATLMTTALLQANLAREVDLRLPDRAPALIFIDIQPGQREPFAQALAGVPQTQLLQEVPSLRARVIRIAGQPVEQVKVSPDVEWTINRDRGLTYQAAKPDDTQLVAGEWWAPDYRGPPLLSLDARLAGGYGVGVGDTLSFNILGRTVEARIANLRQEVDWSNGRLDFLFVMSPGLLEAAPHTFVAAVDVPPEGETALIEAVAEAAPNVTPIPVRAAVRDLGATLRKIGFAVDAVAGVTLLAGVLVLAAGVAAVRDRHRYQSVILKTLGATPAGADPVLSARIWWSRSSERRAGLCPGHARRLAPRHPALGYGVDLRTAAGDRGRAPWPWRWRSPWVPSACGGSWRSPWHRRSGWPECSSSATIGFVTAFVAGVISFLSPCVLPLVPGYLSYVAGTSLRSSATGPPRASVRLALRPASLPASRSCSSPWAPAPRCWAGCCSSTRRSSAMWRAP